MSTYHNKYSQLATDINQQIQAGFRQHNDADDVKKTHLFEGRYENIYLTEKHIPELNLLLAEAVNYAEQILNVRGLRAGYWFNDMPPGSTTTLHRHDDFDELLSAVYYVTVPADSGKLIIHQDENKIEIIPEAGKFVFFKPDVLHEVSRNNSQENRLSIGINFGSITDQNEQY